MSNYTNNKQLATWIKDYRVSGFFAPELLETLETLCFGVGRKWFDNSTFDHHDMFQQFIILFLEKQHLIDLERNIFSYMTTFARNMYLGVYRKKRIQLFSEVGESAAHRLSESEKKPASKGYRTKPK